MKNTPHFQETDAQRPPEPPAALEPALLDAVLAAMPGGFAHIDAAFRFVRVNEAFATLGGIPPPAHTGRAVADVLPWLWPRLEPQLRAVLEHGNPIANIEIAAATTAAPGDIRHWLMAIHPVGPSPGPGGIGLAIQDITPRKRTEAALLDTEEQLRLTRERFSTLRNSPVVVFSQDRDLRYTWFHNSSLGYRIEDLFGLTDHELMERAEDADRITAFKRRVLETGTPARTEVHLVNKGELHWYDLAVRPQYAAGGITGIHGTAVNITEQKNAEERARHNELRLRLALDAALLTSFEWDIQRDEVRRLVSKDPALSPTPEKAPRTFDQVRQAVYPDDRQHFIDRIQAAMAHGDGLYESEFRIVRPDGAIAWLHERGRVERDAAGSPVRLLGLSQDITARKQAEAALRERTERYELIAAGTCDAIWDWDVAGRRVYFSPRWNELHGYPPDDPGDDKDKWLSGIHPEDAPRVLAAMNEHFAGETAVFAMEYRIRRRDGTWRWVLDRGIAFRDGQGRVTRMAGSESDITERKQAEAELRQSREDLDRAQEVSQIGSWRLDVHRNKLTWSAENHRIFGIPEGTPLSYESFLATVHPDDRDYVNDCWSAALVGVPYDIEHRILVDGQVKWVREKAYLETDEVGGLRGGFGITQDITERKRNEEAMREASRRKDEFLAMLAHELRNPLAPIRNSVEILARRTDLAESQIDACHSIIKRQIEHLVRLVDDLLDVSRISRGLIELRKAPLTVAEIVQRALETSQPLIESRHHQLSVCLPAETLWLEGDLVRLAQAVSNLLNNAAKYTDIGGWVWLDVEFEEDQALIRVRDSGRGFDPGQVPHLFDLFYQVDRTLDRAEGGLGIGLSLVEKLVAMHGGRIEAHSEGRGKGSEFLIRLPCSQDPPMALDGGSGPRTAYRPGALRILVVDDNHDAADSLSLLLLGDGHEVLTAYDGAAALKLARIHRPNLALLDIGLPGMDGYDLARELRGDEATRETLLVALTGYGRAADRTQSKAAGFDRHMVKPVDFDELREVLAECRERIPTRPNHGG